jgi:hypothetical protein
VELAAGLRDKEQPLGKRLREVEGPVCRLWAEATAAGGLAAGVGSAERGKNGGWPREQEEEGRCWEQGSERLREGKVPGRPLVLQFSSLPKEGWLAVFREPPELWFPYQGKGGGFKKMRGQGGGWPRFGFEKDAILRSLVPGC